MDRRIFKERGMLNFTPFVTTAVVVAGVVTLAIGIAIPNPKIITIGPVLWFVAIAGRVTTVRNAKYAAIPLAAPSASEQTEVITASVLGSAARRDRIIIRRPSGLPDFVTVYGTCMCLFTFAFPGLDPLTAVFGALGAFFAGGGIVGGRVARYVVTSTHLQIDTGRQTVRIPRQLIGSFAQGRNKVRLVTTDARTLDFRVDSPIADLLDKTGQRTNPRTQVRVVARIAQAMIDIPGGMGVLTGAVEAEPRRWPLRVSIAYGIVLFAIVTLVRLT